MLHQNACKLLRSNYIIRSVASWASCDPTQITGLLPATVKNLGASMVRHAWHHLKHFLCNAVCFTLWLTQNFLCAVGGEWASTERSISVPDPLNGDAFIQVADTQIHEVEPFVNSLRSVPKSGLHNPVKSPDR